MADYKEGRGQSEAYILMLCWFFQTRAGRVQTNGRRFELSWFYQIGLSKRYKYRYSVSFPSSAQPVPWCSGKY